TDRVRGPYPVATSRNEVYPICRTTRPQRNHSRSRLASHRLGSALSRHGAIVDRSRAVACRCSAKPSSPSPQVAQSAGTALLASDRIHHLAWIVSARILPSLEQTYSIHAPIPWRPLTTRFC